MGKGVYFTDVPSKSAIYCRFNGDGDVGLILLCQVALGDTQDLYQRNLKLTGLPNNTFQSVRGCGKFVPTKFELIDNISLATDGLNRGTYQTSFNYNEFVAEKRTL